MRHRSAIRRETGPRGSAPNCSGSGQGKASSRPPLGRDVPGFPDSWAVRAAGEGAEAACEWPVVGNFSVHTCGTALGPHSGRTRRSWQLFGNLGDREPDGAQLLEEPGTPTIGSDVQCGAPKCDGSATAQSVSVPGQLETRRRSGVGSRGHLWNNETARVWGTSVRHRPRGSCHGGDWNVPPHARRGRVAEFK
jgi:hypothetical protein